MTQNLPPQIRMSVTACFWSRVEDSRPPWKANWLVVSTHLKNMNVKMGIFPNFRGENKKYLSYHHLANKQPQGTLHQRNLSETRNLRKKNPPTIGLRKVPNKVTEIRWGPLSNFPWLVGGWTNPIEKYERQIGSISPGWQLKNHSNYHLVFL